MESLDLDPGRIVFPHRCLECGAAPATSYTLEAKAGFDVLLFALLTRIPIEVPLCGPCGRRKTWGRVGWFVLIVAGVVGQLGAVAALRGIAGDTGLAIGGVVLLPVTIAALWWARNREDRLYHRWFSPAWIVTFDAKASVARLGFRDGRTQQEVGVLSGVLDAVAVAGPAAYREHGGPVPTELSLPSSPARAIPGWAVVVVGLALLGVSILKSMEERDGVLWLVARIAGGLAVVGFGLVVWRGQRGLAAPLSGGRRGAAAGTARSAKPPR